MINYKYLFTIFNGDNMITSYKIETLENEEILFLYVDYTEFSLPWLNHFKDYSIQRFIKNNNINFHGKRIFLVLGTGVIVPFLLTNNFYKNKIDIDKQIYVPSILEVMSNKAIEINSSNNNMDNISTNNNNINNNTVNIKEPSSNNSTNNIQGSTNSTNNNQTTNNSNSNTSSNKPINNINTFKPSQSTNNITNTDVNTNDNLPYEDINNTSNEMQVIVKRSTGEVINIKMTDYLIGVVAAEMPASFNIEALKAQAILARTYVMKRIKNNLTVTDTVSTQAYKDNNQLKKMWGSSFNIYYNKIKTAVIETEKEVCLYNGELIDAVYHSTSNGKTEDAKYVWGNSIPYLISVDSSYDKYVSSYLRTVEFDNTKLLKLFGLDISQLDIKILSKNESGRVDKVSINDNIYTGVEFRNIFGLRSSDFDITYMDEKIVITTRGFGHGVGMSQYGANQMANDGYNYQQILNHYYQNISISTL